MKTKNIVFLILLSIAFFSHIESSLANENALAVEKVEEIGEDLMAFLPKTTLRVFEKLASDYKGMYTWFMTLAIIAIAAKGSMVGMLDIQLCIRFFIVNVLLSAFIFRDGGFQVIYDAFIGMTVSLSAFFLEAASDSGRFLSDVPDIQNNNLWLLVGKYLDVMRDVLSYMGRVQDSGVNIVTNFVASLEVFLIYIGLWLLIAFSFYRFIMHYVFIHFYLMIAPITITCLAFDNVRGIGQNALKSLATYATGIVFLSMIFALTIGIFTTMTADLGEPTMAEFSKIFGVMAVMILLSIFMTFRVTDLAANLFVGSVASLNTGMMNRMMNRARSSSGGSSGGGSSRSSAVSRIATPPAPAPSPPPKLKAGT